MILDEQEIIIQREAIDHIKSHKRDLLKRFIEDKKPLPLALFSYFMAGSPGAGKTEFSQRYMPGIINEFNGYIVDNLDQIGFNIRQYDSLFVRIDADEIREFFPQYQKANVSECIKGNAHVIQSAVNRALDILREYCFKNDISFLHDGTFGNLETMQRMVQKSLQKQRSVEIFYIYLDPLIAWEFTKARESIEGRNIMREKFIDQFFDARSNVDIIKKKFDSQIKINCVIKMGDDMENVIIRQDISNIDKFLDRYYNNGSLIRYTKEELLNLITDVK